MGKFYDLMDRELRIRGFAENTRISYLERMRSLVRHFGKPPDQLGPEEVKQYLLFLATNRRLKWSTFLAVRILSTVFRAKLLAALQQAVASGKVAADIRGIPVSKHLRHAARHKWVVYCRRPFAGPRQVLTYLGRYTHRIAISNERIVATCGDQVTFFYQDRADGDQRKPMTLPAEAFLRRFLLHVLPPGFVRIRHYGLLANPIRQERIALCRQLLNVAPETMPSVPPENWERLLLRLTGKDVTRCPQCGAGRLCTICDIPPSAVPPRPQERAASP